MYILFVWIEWSLSWSRICTYFCMSRLVVLVKLMMFWYIMLFCGTLAWYVGLYYRVYISSLFCCMCTLLWRVLLCGWIDFVICIAGDLFDRFVSGELSCDTGVKLKVRSHKIWVSDWRNVWKGNETKEFEFEELSILYSGQISLVIFLRVIFVDWIVQDESMYFCDCKFLY